MQFTPAQRAFLDEVQYAVLGTLNVDGSIQQTVLWYLRVDDVLVLSTGANSVKVRNLRRHPQITLTVPGGARYLSVVGQATIAPPDAALRLRMAERYVGAERAAEWVARRPHAPRVIVRIQPMRAYGQGV
jgi:PPOX class probable F420-dependent enzyme